MKITFIKTCIAFCGVVLLSNNFISCKKSTNNQVASSFTDDAKKWFANAVVNEERDMLAKPYAELPKDDPSRVFARMGKLEALLNWSEAKSYIADKLELLIVPIKETIVTLENKVNAKRCIAFYREQNGKIEMNVIERFIQNKPYDDSDPDFWKTSFLNYFYNGNSRLGNFSADICIYDKGYQFKAGFTVKNGAWKASGVRANIWKVSNAENNFSANNQVTTAANSDCQLWGVWLVWYDDNGNVIDRILLYTYCVYNEGFEDPSLGGGMGDSECYNVCMSNFENMIANTVVSSQIISEATVDIDAIKKYKKPRWEILKNIIGWRLYSQESGIVELVNVQENKWAWLSLDHVGITFEGNQPPGGLVSHDQGIGTPSFVPGAANILVAGMSVNFNVTFSPLCKDCPIVPQIFTPKTKNYTSNAIFNAKP